MSHTVVPWWRPQLGEREFELVADVLRSDYLNDGKVSREFETEIARRFGAKHAVAVTSGTMGLFLALAALGIGKGDEVIVPDMTFIATANAVSLTGATCVLVDVDRETLALSPGAVEKAITKRTKAIVPVHVSGRAGTIKDVMVVASKHSIPIVEDAAEALPSAIRGRCLGTFGVAGMLSYSPNKIMTTGQGGIVLTDSDVVHQKLRALKDQGRPVQGTGGDDVHETLGYNFKFTNVQAAIGIAQLDHLDARLARQRKTYELYRDGLRSVSGIRTFAVDFEGGEVPLWVDAIAERRDELCKVLEREGFPTRNFWHPIHTQMPYKDSDARYPVSTELSPKAVWLPSAFQLRDEDIAIVIRTIRSFYGA